MTENHFQIQSADFTADIALGGEWALHDFAEFNDSDE